MKHLGKLAVLGAVLAATATYANAGTINVVAASYGQTNAPYNPGTLVTSGNSAINYVGFIANSSENFTGAVPTTGYTGGTSEAYDLDPGTTWATPLTGSSWVGVTATAGPTAPNPAADAPAYGYYEFTTTLYAAATNDLLQVYADDTTEVLLNGNVIVSPEALNNGQDSQCAQGSPGYPSCITGTEASVLVSYAANSTLTFIVEQAGTIGNQYTDPSGFDFTITTTPEPSSLMLLGTGLVGAAGMFFRRRVSA